MHFQRVATFVSPDGQETTKCLWLAKDMLPDTGKVEKPGRYYFIFPHKLICSHQQTTTGAYKCGEHWQVSLCEEIKCAQNIKSK